jgi:diguanylate cyclase (GGDEF)-like protein
MATGPHTRARVIVVDDDRLIREIVQDALAERTRVECCDSGESALEALRREPADLVISDLTMPGLSGVGLLDEVRRSHPGTEFIMLTGDATVESAVEALRMGAADYLTKPIQIEELTLVVERILSRLRLLADNINLKRSLRVVESCRNLMRSLDPGEVYVIALDLMLQNLSRQRGIVLFHRSSIPNSDGVAFRGFPEQDARALRDTLVGEKQIDIDAIDSFQIITEGPFHDTLRGIGIESQTVLAVPVRGGEKEAGLLWIFEDGRSFSPEEIELAKIVSGHTDLALANAEQYNAAKERAFTDDVTNIFNARYLLQAADREITRAERYGQLLTVLFLDLDRFKLVNDKHGHLVGSQALRRLSEVLPGCIRQVDTLARYGGDEFTILLVDTPHAVGVEIAERIRCTVEKTIFEAGPENPFRLSISIGVATYPDHGDSRESMLDAADKAMYRAKSLGRNCVCSAEDL